MRVVRAGLVNASGSEHQTEVPHKLISNNASISVVSCIVSLVREHAGIQKSIRSNTWKSPCQHLPLQCSIATRQMSDHLTFLVSVLPSFDNLQHRAVRHTYNGQTKPFKFVVIQKNNQKAFSVNDHFLYSPDLNVWFRGDMVRRN